MKTPNPVGWHFGATPSINKRWVGILVGADAKTILDHTYFDYPTKEEAASAALGLLDAVVALHMTAKEA